MAHSIDVFKSGEEDDRLITYTIRLTDVYDLQELATYLKNIKFTILENDMYALVEIMLVARRMIEAKVTIRIVVSPKCNKLETGSEVLMHYLYYLKRKKVTILSTSSQISDSLLRHISHCDRFSNVCALVMQPEREIREVEQRYFNSIATEPIFNDEDANDLKRLKRIFQTPNPRKKRHRRFTTS